MRGDFIHTHFTHTRTNSFGWTEDGITASRGLLSARAAGVVAQAEVFGVSNHPVCGAKVGFAEIFLMPQPPLLTRRGLSPAASFRLHFLLEISVWAPLCCCFIIQEKVT